MGVNNPSAKGLKKIKEDAKKDTLTSITKDPKAGKAEPKSLLHHKGKKKSK